jgi:hypothetical protein
MPLITNDEGRLVFLPSVDTPGEVSAAPAVHAVSVPSSSMSHLSARQNFLLALARVDDDRACRREAGKRGRESEEVDLGASAAGLPGATHSAAATDVVATACDGDISGSPSEVPTAKESASSAQQCCADEAADDVLACGGAARAHGGTAPSSVGAEVVLHPQVGNGDDGTMLCCPSGGGLHFHLHVESGDRPALAAGWQARGASPELASFLAEVGASEYHDAGGLMVSEVGQCMVIEPGTFGCATTLVSERAVGVCSAPCTAGTDILTLSLTAGVGSRWSSPLATMMTFRSMGRRGIADTRSVPSASSLTRS